MSLLSYKLYCVSCSVGQKSQRWRGATAYTSNSKTLTMQKWRGAREGAREGTKFAAPRGYSKLGCEQVQDCGLTADITKCIKESWPEEAGVPMWGTWFAGTSSSSWPLVVSLCFAPALESGGSEEDGCFSGLGRRRFLPFLSVRVWRFLGCWVSCILGGSDPSLAGIQRRFFWWSHLSQPYLKLFRLDW